MSVANISMALKHGDQVKEPWPEELCANRSRGSPKNQETDTNTDTKLAQQPSLRAVNDSELTAASFPNLLTHENPQITQPL